MAGHVYLIGSRIFNWYKIGKSSNAAIRVSELGILLPFRIEVLAVWRADNHHEMERLLHEKFANHRINGEWFTLSMTQVESLIRKLGEAQVEVGAGFSNIERDSQPNVKRMGISIEPVQQGRGGVGGTQKRIAKIIRENAELRTELQKLKEKYCSQKISNVG